MATVSSHNQMRAILVVKAMAISYHRKLHREALIWAVILLPVGDGRQELEPGLRYLQDLDLQGLQRWNRVPRV
jgi:hypothetical protein